MASDWRASVGLVDEHGIKTRLTFNYHSDQAVLLDGFTEANDAFSALVTDLEAVTDANVYSESLVYLKSGDTALGAAGSDVTDVASVLCYLSGTGEIPKYYTLRIPAPVDGIFEADGVTIDTADPDLIAYVENFLDGAFWVSDGEFINDDINNGIKSGSWTSVKKTKQSVQAAI